jgi:hypothetical protein
VQFGGPKRFTTFIKFSRVLASFAELSLQLQSLLDRRPEPIVDSFCVKKPRSGKPVLRPAGRDVMLLYRISQPDGLRIVDDESSGDIGDAVRSGAPGRYHVDEMSDELLPSGHTSRRWGVVIVRQDGTVSIDPDPWPD